MPWNFRKIEYNVEEDGCWNCTSHKQNPDGYPRAFRNGKDLLIHKFIYEQINGVVPKGMEIRHSCDNPKCINPDHLLLGTHADNMKDMKERERASRVGGPKGEKSYTIKLTKEDVLEIRSHEYYVGLVKQLSQKYKVSESLIRHIRNGTRWKFLLVDTDCPIHA